MDSDTSTVETEDGITDKSYKGSVNQSELSLTGQLEGMTLHEKGKHPALEIVSTLPGLEPSEVWADIKRDLMSTELDNLENIDGILGGTERYLNEILQEVEPTTATGFLEDHEIEKELRYGKENLMIVFDIFFGALRQDGHAREIPAEKARSSWLMRQIHIQLKVIDDKRKQDSQAEKGVEVVDKEETTTQSGTEEPENGTPEKVEETEVLQPDEVDKRDAESEVNTPVIEIQEGIALPAQQMEEVDIERQDVSSSREDKPKESTPQPNPQREDKPKEVKQGKTRMTFALPQKEKDLLTTIKKPNKTPRLVRQSENRQLEEKSRSNVKQFSPKDWWRLLQTGQLVFSGIKADYEAWREVFEVNVHLVDMPWSEKLIALTRAIKGIEPMEALTERINWNARGYATLLTSMDEYYGTTEIALDEARGVIEELPLMRPFVVRDLEEFMDKAMNFIHITRIHDVPRESETKEFLRILEGKLPREYERLYMTWLQVTRQTRSRRAVLTWCQEQKQGLIRTPESTSRSSHREQGYPCTQRITEQERCFLCNVQHDLPQCPKFLLLSPYQRELLITKTKRCFRCLEKGHFSQHCEIVPNCTQCSETNHHELLHGSRTSRVAITLEKEEFDEQGVTGWTNASEIVDMNVVQMTRVEQLRDEITLRILSVYAMNMQGFRTRINVMMDDGSNRTLVSERLARALKLTGHKVTLNLQGVGGSTVTYLSCVTTFWITPAVDRRKYKVSARIIPEPVGPIGLVNWNDYKQFWPHLQHLRFADPYAGPIDLLLGNDYPNLLQSLQEIPGANSCEPHARLTPLGWTAVGPTAPFEEHREDRILRNTKRDHKVYRSMVNQEMEMYADRLQQLPMEQKAVYYSGDQEIHNVQQREDMAGLRELIQKLYEMETLQGDEEEDKGLSTDEKEAIKTLESSRRKIGNQYEVSVLWKPNEPNLPNNYFVAYKRLLSLERNLGREETKQNYHKVFQDWIKKGYIKKVREEERVKTKAWYLPHFPVVRNDKTTTKVRPVLDGAAQCRTKDGKEKSLNDAIFSGPSLINDLCVVLLRFRSRPVAIGGDVSEMFLQILLRPEDRPYHRILYRENPAENIEVYESQVHVFGNTGSPCVAIYTVKQEAKERAKEFPRASEVVLQSSLVDDQLDSFDTIEEAKDVIQDLKKIFQGCGMVIRKFISNSKEVLDSLPEEERASNIDLSEIAEFVTNNLPVVKTLGVVWIANEDNFTFAIEKPTEDVWTKRRVLSHAHRLFDPLGYLTPFTIRARNMSRKHWKSGHDWDDKISPGEEAEWLEWVNDVPKLPSVKIPRCLHPFGKDTKDEELHVFTDASGMACAAVAYLRTTHQDGRVSVVLVMSRAMLSRGYTTPRLELDAAVLGTSLALHINKALSIPGEQIHYWSDSINVLFWLRSDKKSELFVSNRVAKIARRTNLANWRWVNTDNNAADPPSRGIPVDELMVESKWWNGPEFLKQGRESWPVQTRLGQHEKQVLSEDATVPEVAVTAVARINSSILEAEYHGEWNKYVRVLTIPALWILKVQQRIMTRTDPLVRRRAETMALWKAQRQGFPEVFESIERLGHLRRNHPLARIQPEVGKDGLLRARGRLSFAKGLPLGMRTPVIVPKKHHVAELIIRHVHGVELKHVGGTNHTLNQVCQYYWIPRGRDLVKRVLKSCVRCQRITATPRPQKMAPLPDYRILDSKERLAAFHTTALDCAGPFITKRGRGQGKGKRYLLLLTCTQYRAVHFEILHKLDTPSFLMAFSRFTARRGCPGRVVSDNGRNFVGAEAELFRLWTKMDTELQARYPQIKWEFNTPMAPHTGGIFERMIRSAKLAVLKIVGGAELNDEELATVFAEAEGLINSRPISYVANDNDGYDALTPAHFLTGRPVTEYVKVDSSKSLRTRWHYVQILLDTFWRKFLRDCTQRMHAFPKWMATRENPKVGDVVVVLEEKERGIWPIGRIMDVKANRDGLVRTVDVLFNGRVMQRDIQKIVLLDVSEKKV